MCACVQACGKCTSVLRVARWHGCVCVCMLHAGMGVCACMLPAGMGVCACMLHAGCDECLH